MSREIKARILVSLSLKKLSKRSGSSSGVAPRRCYFSERPSTLAESRKTDLPSFYFKNIFYRMSEFLTAAICLR